VKKTALARDAGGMAARAIWLVLCLALIGLVAYRAWLAYQGVGRFSLLWGLLGVLALFGAVGSGFVVFFDTWKADCPTCGEPLLRLSRLISAPALCRSCGTYCMNTKTELEELAPDTVLSDFDFESRLPKDAAAKWPDACSLCGEPATRTIELEVQYASNRGEGTGRKEKVPACDEHEPGVKLLRMGFADRAHFKSLAYWRAFSDENGTLPRS